MTGKEKCTLLKSIRCRIARKNGIEYSTPECTFQGECKGTCPKCEAELRALTAELERIKQSGKRVAVAGIAAAMVVTSASACAPASPEEQWEAETDGFVEELTGDVAFEGEGITEELEGNTIEIPHLSHIVSLPDDELLSEIQWFSRTMLQESWSIAWVEQTENADVYVLDGKTLAITFGADGRAESVVLSEDE